MDYATEFVNQFVTQLAIKERGLRNMHAYYLFHDTREGSIEERFTADAREFWEYQKLFKA